MKKLSYLSILFLVILPSLLFSQTANKDKGCIPLKVEFAADSQSGYYWEFGDGATSDNSAPLHIYTNPGTYEATLYTDQSKSTLVGAIEIDVYPDVRVEIASDLDFSCTEIPINFSNTVTTSDEVSVTDFLWTFGDGASSDMDNPRYNYRDIGIYDVSLEVKTDYPDCDKTLLVPEMIEIFDHRARFSIDKYTACSAPGVFTVQNNSVNDSRLQYDWVIGGDPVSGYDPGSITIASIGRTEIYLTITSDFGCTDISSQSVRVLDNALDIDVPLVTCHDMSTSLTSHNDGVDHRWDFGDNAVPKNSRDKNPKVKFNVPGVTSVYYSMTDSGCLFDTTFQIIVDDNIADFDYDHGALCGSTIPIHMTAKHKGMSRYYWNGALTSSSDDERLHLDFPERDSFYVNEKEIVVLSLYVDSGYGCVDEHSDTIVVQQPEAFFIPDSVIGYAPLTIGFKDASLSTDPITSLSWDFDDGTTVKDDTLVVHTFVEPGKYYVQSEVVTEAGCRDVSKGTFITALGSGGGGGGGGSGGGGVGIECLGGQRVFCVGEEIDYNIVSSISGELHLETDEGRFNHCWKHRSGTHTFLYPGVFPMVLISETEGFEKSRDTFDYITILGSRAEIDFQKTCDNIYATELSSKSITASYHHWYYEGALISEEKNFNYTFGDKGVKEVILEVGSGDSECVSHRDTAYIHVTEPFSEFTMDRLLCSGEPYVLDASASTEFDESCSHEFHWEFEQLRPISADSPIWIQEFLPGNQEVVLTVTDVNGCSSSSSKTIDVYGTQIDFPLDTSVCLPHQVLFENMTVSDTAMVSWEWSFGSSEEDPDYVIEEPNMPGDNGAPDSLFITLHTEDALGCRSSLTKMARIYEPHSRWSNFIPSELCLGDDLRLKVISEDNENRLMQYDWEWTTNNSITNNSGILELQMDTAGVTEFWVDCTVAGTICTERLQREITVRELPEADFATSVDSLDFICYPHTVEFHNTSFTDGSVDYSWDFDNGSNSSLEDPATTYDRGVFNPTLTATSRYGCEDSKTVEIELIGPDGNLVVTDDHLCLGEEAEIKLTNPVDIASYTWDLGDGTVVTEVNTINHTYDFIPETGMNTVNLVLQSAESSCEAIKSAEIFLHAIPEADFEMSEDEDGIICHPARIDYNNLSENESDVTYNWDLGNGTQTATTDPSSTYDKGDYDVTLVAESSWGCYDERSLAFTVVGPEADIIADDIELCLGDTVQFSLLDPVDVGQLSWDFGDGNTAEESLEVIHNYNGEAGTTINTVTVNMISDENGCEHSVSLDVAITGVVADFELDAEMDYCGGLVGFINLSENGDSFLWNFGDGNTSEESNPQHNYDQDGFTPVTLWVEDSDSGCEDELTKDIPITAENEFYDFANVFSPNGDGRNDYFRAVIPQRYQEYVTPTSFKIYDKWGQLIYDNEDVAGWDGTYKGKALPPDVYAYFIEIDIEACKVVHDKGNVTLIK